MISTLDELQAESAELDKAIEVLKENHFIVEARIRPFDRVEGVKRTTRAEIVSFAEDYDATLIETREQFYEVKKLVGFLDKKAFSLDINGNKTAILWEDKNGEFYYCTSKGLIIAID